MADHTFGVELAELDKIQHDWQSASKHMGELNQQLSDIKSTLVKAAAIDLAAAPIAQLPGFGIAYQVLTDVKEILQITERLEERKGLLLEELAEDAKKIKQVKDEYEANEKKIEDKLKKAKDAGKHDDSPPPGHHSGSGNGTGRTGDDDGGHGGGGPAPAQGQGDGKWKTEGDWDAWSPGKHHTTTGAGVETAPDTSGLPQERKDIVDRALERVNHRIGYSQSATTNGYRDDCSGFVSAAWGLKPPGLNTYGLMGSDTAHQITKDDLQPGDALVAGDHTVLFGGWADASHTKYVALEDNGSQGTVSHVIPYPYYSGDAAQERAGGHPYVPYRRNGL
ncbi:hypothetical protein [Streptomyces benahoarensis]|uniref:NlpC/P60 domain-containing protein n=1 Tax=Streptomyces benahoarensis TaxID=2595054 RepID=A0A553Z8M4_9ACTN|nr:hypothetical protein [Streptomyces benahoarensis]TSB19698.1 hypothetical protein FNJ62_21970 [Streptomyces benahoarensis]TSB37799.1 hypothetical protein FNZ23_17970 [Streptomyces benahoarensis]